MERWTLRIKLEEITLKAHVEVLAWQPEGTQDDTLPDPLPLNPADDKTCYRVSLRTILLVGGRKSEEVYEAIIEGHRILLTAKEFFFMRTLALKLIEDVGVVRQVFEQRGILQEGNLPLLLPGCKGAAGRHFPEVVGLRSLSLPA